MPACGVMIICSRPVIISIGVSIKLALLPPPLYGLWFWISCNCWIYTFCTLCPIWCSYYLSLELPYLVNLVGVGVPRASRVWLTSLLTLTNKSWLAVFTMLMLLLRVSRYIASSSLVDFLRMNIKFYCPVSYMGLCSGTGDVVNDWFALRPLLLLPNDLKKFEPSSALPLPILMIPCILLGGDD